MKPEQLEIEKLRREVAKLKAERDILKKAAAYFAKDVHEVHVHCEAPGDLAPLVVAAQRLSARGGMVLRSAGRIPVGLPCLAHPIAEPAQSGRRGDQRKGKGELHRVGADLRRKTRLARRAGGRHRLRPSPHRAADACAGLASQAHAGLGCQRMLASAQRLPRTCWTASSVPSARTSAGSPTSPMSGRRKAGIMIAAVIDLFSRRVVGWSMKAEMTAQLVTDALVMAIWRRGKPDALLHHSDSQRINASSRVA